MLKLFVLGLLLLTACESESEKVNRLRAVQASYCMDDKMSVALAAERYKVAGHTEPPPPEYIDSIRGAWFTKCDLATRELNQFLNGR